MILSEKATKTWKPVLDSLNLDSNITDKDKDILSFFCSEYNKLVPSLGFIDEEPSILPRLIKVFVKCVSKFNTLNISYSFCNKSDENPDVMLNNNVIEFVKVSEFKRINTSLLIDKNVFEYIMKNEYNYIESKIESIHIDKCVDSLVSFAISNNNNIVIKIGGNSLQYLEIDTNPKLNLSFDVS